MLVLSRKKDQTLVIGDDIEITVIDIQGDQIRLGVDAPKHVKIFRKELYEEIQEENRNAANLAKAVAPAKLRDMLGLDARQPTPPIVVNAKAPRSPQPPRLPQQSPRLSQPPKS